MMSAATPNLCWLPVLPQVFLDAAKPVTAVVLAHNGMNSALQHIQTMHPRLHFVALSPHVAAAARHALQLHAHWLLPTFTFVGKVRRGAGGMVTGLLAACIVLWPAAWQGTACCCLLACHTKARQCTPAHAAHVCFLHAGAVHHGKRERL